MARDLKVLVLVLSFDREPWRSLEAAQSATWLRPQEGVKILHLRGISSGLARAVFLAIRRLADRFGLRHAYDAAAGRLAMRLPVTLDGDVIQSRTFEYWIGTSAKTHAGLKYIARTHQFDYLVRTNSSTYIHLPRLLEHLATAPRTGYYAGADQGEAHGHARGTLIILSDDVVQSLAADESWSYNEVDDMALGRAAIRLGAPLVRLKQITVPQSTAEISALADSTDHHDFIFRIKNRADRWGDADRLRVLHAAFIGQETSSETGDSTGGDPPLSQAETLKELGDDRERLHPD